MLLRALDGPLIDGALQLDTVQFDFPRIDAAASFVDSALAEASPSFIAGPENRLLAPPLQRLLNATDVTDLAEQFNPLILVGPSGSGKSHLARGIVRAWGQRFDASEIAYFTAADFGRERQAAEVEERLTAWRDQIRAVRLLVIEDLDRLRTRATIQQELRTTIDVVIAAGGTVIVTAHCEPTGISHLDAGLRDRLTAGLTVRINRPDLATRRALLAQTAAARGLALEPAELDRLAQKDCGTPAQLLGRLAQSQVSSGYLSSAGRAREREGSGYQLPTPTPHPSPQGGGEQRNQHNLAPVKHILAVTARYFGVTQAVLTGPSRRKSLVQARNIIVYLSRQLTDLSYADIGRALGNRDHTTIMHADRRLTESLATDSTVRQAVDELDRIVRS
jgi:chromosomal replication initiator protein